MKRWLKEPLVHFVLLGAGLFVLDAILGERRVEARSDAIVVSPGRIENLAAIFARTWQRPPTEEELRGLVDDHVLEEALYREGIALGVDQDDIIIRRRVRQKMEFLVDDVVELAAPTEAELEAWLANHADSYTRPARHRFRQVYLNPEQRGEALEADAARLLEELRSGSVQDASALGDRSLLAHAYGDDGAGVVERSFGPAFASRLAELPTGEWAGPIESPFGVHLILVDARTEASVPALDHVRDDVERDWRHAQREEASTRYYEELLARYHVSIEWPELFDPEAGTGPEEVQQ